MTAWNKWIEGPMVDRMNDRHYMVCTRCVMDTTVPEIVFDEHGVCQFCGMHDEMSRDFALDPEHRDGQLTALLERVKASNKRGTYDCICGVSGGRDSTWTLYQTCQLGLKPLAVHFDNGWNSDIAVSNIMNATRALDVDLETVVADWSEFRELQIAFLRAAVPDVEIPTDVAIHSVLHEVAAREGIKYIFNGHSFRTEGIAPKGWTYMDGRYIDSVYRLFHRKPLRDFHNFKIKDLIYHTFIKGIKVVPILNYFEYNPPAVEEIVSKKLGWKPYGGHHYESTYTKFVQSYYLPYKFKIDKRKTELSALIRSGYADREEALREIESRTYELDESLLEYVLSKLEITSSHWQEILELPKKTFRDYRTYFRYMRVLRWPIKVACRLNLLPRLLYLKYLG